MRPWGELTGIRPVKVVRNYLENGMTPREATAAFVEKYHPNEQKTALALEIAKREIALLRKARGICVYIGIPFCRTRCAYCSFVTNTAGRNLHLMEPYIDALEIEIKHSAQMAKNLGFVIDSVYIGGGTPTALTAPLLSRLLHTVTTEFDLSRMQEFVVEAGRPDTIDREKLTLLKQYGITRISINPQSMREETLKTIGRLHTAEQICDCFSLARECGHENINMDLIAGLPGESEEDFRYSVEKLLELDPESITVHTLAIKRGAVLWEMPELFTMPSGDTVRDMVLYAEDILPKKGYYPYYLYRQKNMPGDQENVGYAKDGFECLYNVMIMEETATILSLGAGGVTKMVSGDRIERIFNMKEADEYIRRLDEMIKRKDKIYEFLGDDHYAND